MIVMDLEWNRGYDKTPLNEILQIGAVRIDRLGGPVLDTFNIYIRPAIHKKFDPGAKKLPELQSSLDARLDFPAAIQRFRLWCGAEREFGLWGDDDLSAINKSCQYWKVPPLEMETVYNFQRALACIAGTDQQIALWRAVEYCKIPDVFTFHNALNDALYTAILGEWLTREALAWEPVPAQRKRRRVSLKLSALPFEPPMEKTVGPFQTAEMARDARESRRPACPVCGKTGCVGQWRLDPESGGRRCFSIFSCQAHGRFLCQMVLRQREDGQLQGQLTVPPAGPELIRDYLKACQGEQHVCRRSGKRRRRAGRGGAARRRGPPSGP